MTLAVGLLVLAALAVVGAAVSGSWLLVTLAAGLGVLLGAAAVRITHTELVESRVAAARDRATQAHAYLELAEQRSAENEDYLCELRTRLAEKEQSLDELELAVSLAQRRAATSTRRRYVEGRRATSLETQLADAERIRIAAEASVFAADQRESASRARIAELEQEVLALRSELETVTAVWRRRHA